MRDEMNAAKRVVTRIPLTQLWTDAGTFPAVRGSSLNKNAIGRFLRAGRLRFVVANVGMPLQWIPESDCFDFWKSKGSANLAEPDAQVRLEQFPNGYCYWASEWQAENGPKIVLLEKAH